MMTKRMNQRNKIKAKKNIMKKRKLNKNIMRPKSKRKKRQKSIKFNIKSMIKISIIKIRRLNSIRNLNSTRKPRNTKNLKNIRNLKNIKRLKNIKTMPRNSRKRKYNNISKPQRNKNHINSSF